MKRQVQIVLLSMYSRSWLDLENAKVNVSLDSNGIAILTQLGGISSQSDQAMARILARPNKTDM